MTTAAHEPRIALHNDPALYAARHEAVHGLPWCLP